MMNPIRCVILASVLLAPACAPLPIEPSLPDAQVHEAGPDAAADSVTPPTVDAGPDAADAVPPVDAAPLPPIPADPRCETLAELATEAHRVVSAPSAVLTYAMGGILADQDHPIEAEGCSRFRAEGGDTSVRFTAPRAGTWRFVAEGMGLSLMRIRRGCTNSCSDAQSAMTGASLSPRITNTWSVQQGETIEIVMDGCPSGTTCAFSLRAERWGALTCRDDSCPSAHTCQVEREESPRVTCVPTLDLRTAERFRVRTLTVETDATTGQGWLGGALNDGADWRLRVSVTRWLLADGSSVTPPTPEYLDETWVRLGAIEPFAFALRDPRYVGAELALSGHRATETYTVRFTPWRRPALGEPCVVGDVATQCVAPMHCHSETSRCVTTAPLTMDTLRAFQSRSEPYVRLRVTGSLTAATPTGRAEVRAGAGPWVASTYPFYQVYPLVRGRSEFALERSAHFSEQPWTEARLTLTDTAGHTVSRTVPIEPTREVGLTERCGALDTSCAAPLECAYGDDGAQRCMPRQTRDLCSLGETVWPLRWTPTEARSEITASGYGSPSAIALTDACVPTAQHRELPTDVLFEAPVSGRYRFSTESVAELRHHTLCTQIACEAGGWTTPIVFERTVRTGEPLLLSLRPFQRAGRVVVRAERLD
ncbi:MAG: hypothetical protein Q8Q09_16030 [Deltaproteobacteria bacterium]|nr:hypothetical protein [Deltaproteobacteria bacterium]